MKSSRGYIFTLLLAMMVLCAVPVVHANADWEPTSAGKKYKTSSGYYVDVIKTIDDSRYYFDKNGIMVTKQFVTKDGKLYYFGSDGKMVTGGKFKVGTKYYYARAKGSLYTDKWLDGTYYFQSDGSMAVSKWIKNKYVNKNGKYTGKYKTGWVDDATTGDRYYYLSASKYATGWVKDGSKWYYMNSKGVMQKKTWINDNYYVNSKGARVTNTKKTIKGKDYIFDKNGLKLTSQWVKYKGNYYRVAKNGAVRKSTWVGSRYVDKNGVRVTGWKTIDGKRYYFNKSTAKKTTGKATISKKNYYFESSGALVKSAWATDNYYANSKGVLLTGLNEVDGDLYYFNKNTCKKVTKKLKTVNGNKYFFKVNSGMAARNERVYYGTSFYYFDADGKMVTNQWVNQYYYGSDGKQEQIRNTGWVKSDNGDTYYYNSKYQAVTGLQTIDGYQYYFNSKGVMQTGIVKIGSDKYYFGSDGRMQKSTTVTVGSTEYTINSSGKVTKETSIAVSTNTGSSSSSKGTQIANYALQYVGNPYVYGGTSLTNGADCSGFVQTVFKNNGYTLLRTADEQMKGPSSSQIKAGYTKGTEVKVSTSTLQPGDLLFYGTSSYASHVAIYIGNGQIVHASNSQPYPAGGIKISNYNYDTPVKAMRYWS